MAAESIFVLGSCTLEDSEANKLFQDIFGSISTDEIKHTVLRREAPELVVKFVSEIIDKYADKFGAYAVHKKYALVAKLIDSWIESSLYEMGKDFYKNNGHRVFAILLYFSLTTLEDPSFCRKVLLAAQQMMNSRKEVDASSFFTLLTDNLLLVNQDTRAFFEGLLSAAEHLGNRHAQSMGENALDLCIPALLSTVAYWRNQTTSELEVLHDKASELEQVKWMWDGMADADAPPAIFEREDLKWEFPLNVKQTNFVDSIDHKQIQFCDLLAGATAEMLRYRIGEYCDVEYAQKLIDAGLEDLLIGWVWPLVSDAKFTKQTVNHQEKINYFVNLLKSVSKSNGRAKPALDAVQESEKVRRYLQEGKNNQAFGSAKRLANAGYPFFKCLCAEMFAEGIGVSQNIAQALSLWREAADKNFSPAQRTLALAYVRGSIVEKNEQQAVELMEKAANLDNILAQHDMGCFYYKGTGVVQSFEKAAEWMTKASDAGHAESQRELASLYMQGEGVPLNHNKAFDLYTRAAHGRDILGLFFVGQMHQHGDACRKDMAQAFKFWKEAAEMGHEISQFNVGLQLVNGVGVKQNIDEGIYWLKKAADANYPQAISALEQISKKRK
jgi:hypothetical protein